jgi:type VI secretion system protein ImpK
MLCSDFLILGASLKTAGYAGDPESLRARLLEMFPDWERRGEALGYPQDVIRQASYALAAFLDEMIMNSRWPERHKWASHPLQFELFQTQIAGVEFFDHLDAVRRKLPLNIDLLELFYLCLVLGFQGQYRVSGRERLKALIEEIRRDLQIRCGEAPPLAPHVARPDEGQRIPSRTGRYQAIGAAAAAVALVLYIVLAVMIRSDADVVASEIKKLTTQMTEVGP